MNNILVCQTKPNCLCIYFLYANVRGTLLYGDVDRISPSRILDISRNRKTKAAIYMKIYLAYKEQVHKNTHSV